MCDPYSTLYCFEPLDPINALGDSARKYSLELAQELGAPVNMVACTLIPIFAAAQVGASCFVSKNFQVGMSMYFAVGAPSGASKSPCEARQRKVLEELIVKHILLSPEEKRYILAKREIYKQQRKKIKKESSSAIDEIESSEYARELADIDAKLEKMTIPVSPMMGNMSIPSFVEELSIRNGCGIRIDSEGGILAQLNTVSSTKLTSILDVWSNGPVDDITMKKQVIVQKPFFVTLTMWQTEPLCQFISNKTYIGIGLVARWLIYIENDWRPQVGRGCVSTQSEEWYKSQLERALLRTKQNIYGKSGGDNFALSEDARIVLSQFKYYLIQSQAKGQIYANYQDIAQKLDVQAVRIAMALSAMEYCGDNNVATLIIGPDIMRRACCLALYFANTSIVWIENGRLEAVKKEALPIIEGIISYQENNYVEEFITTESLSKVYGYTKSKIRRLMYWMVKNGWVHPEIRIITSSLGNSEEQEGWIPRILFKNLNIV